MAVAPGSQVANFRLVRLLGEGGMGSVWLAEHLTLGTQAAVKFILDDYVDDEELMKRFTQEARVAARLQSPHSVRILDHGNTAGVPYIVMEYLEGEGLDTRLERGVMSTADAADLAAQMESAVGEAHQSDVVHRDIKPANIFLLKSSGPEIHAKVLDFGIAKDLDLEASAKTKTASVLGTPQYMSPEQLTDTKAVDGRTDLWALAVVYFEVLTGQRPFDGESITSLAVQICTKPHKSAHTLRPDLPPSIDAFFNRAFHKSLAARHANMSAFAADFKAALGATAQPENGPSAPPTAVAGSMVPGQRASQPPADSPITARMASIGARIPKAPDGGETAPSGSVSPPATVAELPASSMVPPGATVAAVTPLGSAAGAAMAGASAALGSANVPTHVGRPFVADHTQTSKSGRGAIWFVGAVVVMGVVAVGLWAAIQQFGDPESSPKASQTATQLPTPDDGLPSATSASPTAEATASATSTVAPEGSAKPDPKPKPATRPRPKPRQPTYSRDLAGCPASHLVKRPDPANPAVMVLFCRR